MVVAMETPINFGYGLYPRHLALLWKQGCIASSLKFQCGCYATLFPWQRKVSRIRTISEIDRGLHGNNHGNRHSFIQICSFPMKIC